MVLALAVGIVSLVGVVGLSVWLIQLAPDA